jgi:phosphohistidine phosphatase SixA
MRKKFSPPVGCVLVVLGLLAIIFANSAKSETSAALSNATILIIRHAEEPSKGDGLSSRGTARAQGYVEYFKNFTIDGKPVKIDYLFAASDSSNSRRPRLTLEPIAQALGISIDSQFKSKDFLKLAQKIETLPQGSNVLVCWHHSDIPNLIGALGADAEKVLTNGKWPGKVYGWLIQLRYNEKGNLFASKRIKEHLFKNDKASNEDAFANAL